MPEAGEFSEGSAIKDPVLDGEVTLPVAQTVDGYHAVGEVLSVTTLVKTHKEMFQIPL